MVLASQPPHYHGNCLAISVGTVAIVMVVYIPVMPEEWHYFIEVTYIKVCPK